jgi:hypothetical protein
MDFSDLAKLASGHAEARIVQVAVELKIFETIGSGVLEANIVANSLDLEPVPLS